MLGNADDASDVCQEALVKAYQNIARLREGAKFKSWVHHILFNLCRDRFRSTDARRLVYSYEEGDLDESPQGTARATARSADHHADSGNVRDVLSGLLQRIPEEQRRSILLREYHGFSSEEIAEMTGVPAATVRTRIFYGLKAVRKLMRERGLSERDF
jgi:RNA polymerase sigma-70 factor (ECF subfamily)